jgi:hypothetical protein
LKQADFNEQIQIVNSKISFDLFDIKRDTSRRKEITIVLFLIVALVYVNLYKNAFALSTYCDVEGYPPCYSVGYDEVKQGPVIRCSNDHNEHFCEIQDVAISTLNNDEIQNVGHYSLSISSNSNSNQDANLFLYFCFC